MRNTVRCSEDGLRHDLCQTSRQRTLGTSLVLVDRHLSIQPYHFQSLSPELDANIGHCLGEPLRITSLHSGMR